MAEPSDQPPTPMLRRWQGCLPAAPEVLHRLEQLTGAVLMLAWMNREAIEQTLTTGRVVYFSRSRQALWRKGDTSGNTQGLVSLRFDCDADAILLAVNQLGPACHTHRANCFYLEVRGDSVVVDSEPVS